MLTGNAIDNMVVGGPAYNSGKLQKGDVIVEVDNVPATIEGLHRQLIGNDIAGSSVLISVRKPNGNIIAVVLKRIETEAIADRRRMFEIFTSLKVSASFLSVFRRPDSCLEQERAIINSDDVSTEKVDDCIQLWTRMLIADEIHDKKIADNIMQLQKECIRMISELEQNLKQISRDDHFTRERAAPPVTCKSQEEFDTLATAHKEELQNLRVHMQEMVPKQDLESLRQRMKQTEVDLERVQKLLSASVPKERADSLAAQVRALQQAGEGLKARIQRQESASSSAERELSGAREAAEELAGLLQRTVSTAHYNTKCAEALALSHEAEQGRARIAALEVELEDGRRDAAARLKAAQEESVPRPAHEALQQSLREGQLELERARKALEDSVPKRLLQSKEAEARSLSDEVRRVQAHSDRLQKGLATAEEELRKVGKEAEAGRRAAEEAAALKRAADGMVPRAAHDALQDRARERELELERARRQLEGSVPRAQLEGKCDEAAALGEEAARLRAEAERVRADLAAAHQTAAQARKEAEEARRAAEERLESALEASVPRARHAALQDSLEQSRMELERVQKQLEGSVPRVLLQAKEDEVAALSAELERAQVRADRLQKGLAAAQSEAESLSAQADAARSAGLELAALKRAADGMVPRAAHDALQDRARELELEMERARRQLEGSVPRAQLEGKCDEAAALGEEAARQRREAGTLREGLSAARAELEDLKVRLQASELEAAALRSEAALGETKRARQELMIKSLIDKCAALVPRQELDLALEAAAGARQELGSLRAALAQAGLATAAQLRVFLMSLEGHDPAGVSALLDKVKIHRPLSAAQLCRLLDACLLLGGARVADVADFVEALARPPGRPLREVRDMLALLGDPDYLSLEEIGQLCRLLRGPPRMEAAQLQALASGPAAGADAEVLCLRSALEELRAQNEALRAPAAPVISAPLPAEFDGSLSVALVSPAPDAAIYYTLDGTPPGPHNFAGSGPSPVEIELVEPCTVSAVCVAAGDGARPSRVSSATFAPRARGRSPRERAAARPDEGEAPAEARGPGREQLGGIGMLIERYRDGSDGQSYVKVMTLVSGGAAQACGHVRPGDLLLAVDGQDVRGRHTDAILRLIAGPEGSAVSLTLMRFAEAAAAAAGYDAAHPRPPNPNTARCTVFHVSLRRSCAGFLPQPDPIWGIFGPG